MEQKYCQCCAMPMDNAGEMYGTNSEGFFPYTETLERQIIIEKAQMRLCLFEIWPEN